MPLTLQAVAAQNIRGELWTLVREGLAHAIEKTGQHFIAEDVFVMLTVPRVEGGFSAYLYLVMEGDDRRGFVVLQQVRDPDGPVLFVFAAYGPGTLPAPDVHLELENIARSFGAKRLRQWGRKGWLSVDYWKAKAIVFEHELT